MKSVQVMLNSIEKVKGFVDNVSKFDNEFELIAGRYCIDAKSVMGIFSLDLAKPICLNIHVEDDADKIVKALAGYII